MLQRRTIIKIISGVLLLFVFTELAFNIMAFYIENKAEAFADAQASVIEYNNGGRTNPAFSVDSFERLHNNIKRNFLDSTADKLWVYVPYFWKAFPTYNVCKRGWMPGPDFSGKMHLEIQIEQDDLLKKLAGNSSDAQFNQALTNTKELWQPGKTDFLGLFMQQFEQLDNNKKLAVIFCSLPQFHNRISETSTNKEVINELRKDFDKKIERFFQIAGVRTNMTDGKRANIKLQSDKARIVIDITDVQHPERLIKLLNLPGKLEFLNTYESQEVIGWLTKANTDLAEYLKTNKDSFLLIKNRNTLNKLKSVSDTTDVLEISKERIVKDTIALSENPLFEVLFPNVTLNGGKQEIGTGPMVGRSYGKDTARVNWLLSRPGIKEKFPSSLRLVWSAHTLTNNSDVFGLYAVKQDTASEEVLTNDQVTDAYKSFDQYGMAEVDITMSDAGASIFEEMTEKAVDGRLSGMPVKRCIAIVVDDRVFSAPRVQQKILGGRVQLSGIEDINEASDLATVLYSGMLPAKADIVVQNVSLPDLGASFIHYRLLAILMWVSLMLLCLYMLFRS